MVSRIRTGQAEDKKPCVRCEDATRRWDQIEGKTHCPNCIEEMVMGITAALREKARKTMCLLCTAHNSITYKTFPKDSKNPIEMDLCATHIRALLERGLGPQTFGRLKSKLMSAGLSPDSVFFLHDAFYDQNYNAIQPVREMRLEE